MSFNNLFRLVCVLFAINAACWILSTKVLACVIFFTLSVSSVKKTVNGHVFNSSMWIHTDDKQIYICFQLQKNHVNRSRRLFVSVHTYTQYARYAVPKHNNYRLMRHRILKMQTICIYYSVLYLQLVIHFMFMLQNGSNCWFKFGLYAVFCSLCCLRRNTI